MVTGFILCADPSEPRGAKSICGQFILFFCTPGTGLCGSLILNYLRGYEYKLRIMKEIFSKRSHFLKR